MIYGNEGTQALFTGLATQIIYGGCDHDTANFYSDASGTTTADANINPDPQKANYRQRPLLTVDEVVTPQMGNCTIFARYVEAAFATQIILTARLTRLYEREDWKIRLKSIEDTEPLMLERGVSIKVQPTFALIQPAKPQPQPRQQDALAQAAMQAMARATTKPKPTSVSASATPVEMTDVQTMKRRLEAQRQAAAAKQQTGDNDVPGQE